MLDAASVLASKTSLPDVLAELTFIVVSSVGHARATISLWNERRSTVTVAACSGETIVPLGVEIPFDDLSEEARVCLSTKTSQYIDYDSLPPGRRGHADRVESHLALDVPLVYQGRLVGLLAIDDAHERRTFTREETEIAEAIGAHAALAIEKARLVDALRKAEADAKDLIRYAPTGIYEIDFRGPSLMSVNDAMCVLSGYSREELMAMNPMDLLDEDSRDRFRDRIGRTLAGEEVPGDVEYRVLKKDGTFIYVVLNTRPITDSHGRAYGAFVVGHDVTERRQAEDERRRLLEGEQVRSRLAEASVEIESALHASHKGDEMLVRALEKGAVALGADSTAIGRNRDDAIEITHSHGFPEDITGLVVPVETERHAFLAMSTREPVLVEDVATDARVDSEHLLSYGVAAVMVVPLIFSGKAEGVLYYNFAQPRRFRPQELTFARRLASSITMAIENARLFEAERRSFRAASALNTINDLLLSTLTVDEMLERIVSETSRAVAADKAIVADLAGGDIIIRHVNGFPRDLLGKRFPLSAFPAVERAIYDRRPGFIQQARANPDSNNEFANTYGDESFMTLPLIASGKVIGALSYCYDRPQQFDQHDVEFADRLSRALSLAMEKARRFEAERDIANRLQEALITLPERLPGVQFAHAYHSATDAARVGGDFYDIFELDQCHVGVTIGDVAGKGIDAAVLTSLAKNTIRAHASERGKTPSQILELTNEVVFKGTPRESFMTIFLGIVDCRDGRLVYANAGHTTSAIVKGGGSTAGLGPTGAILGAFPDTAYGQGEVWLEPEDILFLYTDGLTEARRGTEQYGEDRLFEFLTRTPSTSLDAHEMVQRVVADVMSFTGEKLRDDLAVIALRRLDSGLATQQKFAM